MIYEEFLDNDKLFRLDSVLCAQGVHCQHKIQRISADECRKRRQDYERLFYENDKPTRLVKLLAESGKLNKYFSNNIIKKAKKTGELPNGYQIHHIIPIKLGGTDELNNFSVVDASVHRLMHKLIYQPILDRLADGEKAFMVLPIFKSVINQDDHETFFLRRELRQDQKEQNVAILVKNHKRPWDNLNADLGRRDAFTRTMSFGRA